MALTPERLGPAVPMAPHSERTIFSREYIDKEDEPLACFVFKYRSMGMSIHASNGIAPAVLS